MESDQLMFDCLVSLITEAGIDEKAILYLRVSGVLDHRNQVRSSIDLSAVPQSRRQNVMITATLGQKISSYLSARAEAGSLAPETALFPRFSVGEGRTAASAQRALRRAFEKIGKTKTELKSEAIRQSLDAGMTPIEVSRRFGITEREVKDVWNGTIQKGGQARKKDIAVAKAFDLIEAFEAENRGVTEIPDDLLDDVPNLPEGIKNRLLQGFRQRRNDQ